MRLWSRKYLWIRKSPEPARVRSLWIRMNLEPARRKTLEVMLPPTPPAEVPTAATTWPSARSRLGCPSLAGADGQWAYDKATGSWSFVLTGGSSLRGQWAAIRATAEEGFDSWYYFDWNGTLQAGWLQSGGQWYYLNPATTEPSG